MEHVDAFMAAAETGDAALDTLKEIQEFLNSDSGVVQTLVDDVAKNKENIADVIDGTTPVAKATNADKAADADKLGGVAAADYLKKADAPGYADILTQTNAATLYQPKGEYATAEQGAKADTAVQPATLENLPHARRTAMTVATTIHHFSRPLIRQRPRTKRKMVMAPIYIGPAVKGCGPQYRGIDFNVCFRLG